MRQKSHRWMPLQHICRNHASLITPQLSNTSQLWLPPYCISASWVLKHCKPVGKRFISHQPWRWRVANSHRPWAHQRQTRDSKNWGPDLPASFDLLLLVDFFATEYLGGKTNSTITPRDNFTGYSYQRRTSFLPPLIWKAIKWAFYWTKATLLFFSLLNLH